MNRAALTSQRIEHGDAAGVFDEDVAGSEVAVAQTELERTSFDVGRQIGHDSVDRFSGLLIDLIGQEHQERLESVPHRGRIITDGGQ